MKVRAAVVATVFGLFLAAPETRAAEFNEINPTPSPYVTLNDDTDPNKAITFNTETGDYKACTPEGTAGGTGKVKNYGCTVQLQDIRPGRRVVVDANVCDRFGKASVNIWGASSRETMRMTIVDSNVTEDSSCGR